MKKGCLLTSWRLYVANIEVAYEIEYKVEDFKDINSNGSWYINVELSGGQSKVHFN